MSSFLDLPEAFLKELEIGNEIRTHGYRGRFAPSPSGSLHLGNLRTALLSWLRSRLFNGSWLLRIDDLDRPRNRPESLEKIKQDLLWLGLKWDVQIIKQSHRIDLYNSILYAFKKQRKLYACRCTRKDLAQIPHDKNQQFIYPGTCREKNFSLEVKTGRQPCWRLIVKENFSTISGDVILRRSDGFIAYHLATVIDELTLGISEVIRGEDLRPSLAPQFAICDALGQNSFQCMHVPLLLSNGRKLSKRDESEGLDFFRSQGWNSGKVIGWLGSSMKLVPKGSELSSLELLDEIKKNLLSFDSCFEK